MFDFIDTEKLAWIIPGLKAFLIISSGYFIAQFLSRLSKRACLNYATPQQSMILKKVVFFGLFFLFLISALQQLGFKLSVLLGSAGIATAAIGFASKTTISNMISGIFLIIEKSIAVGDKVKVNGYTGKVSSIDLLSVKLICPDNTYVRVPNETVLSTTVVNHTKFPKIRLDMIVGISYEQDVEPVRKALFKLIEENKLCLSNPAPKVVVSEFGDSSVNLRLSVWVKKNDYADLKDMLHENIKSLCDDGTIDMPFQQLTVHMSQ